MRKLAILSILFTALTFAACSTAASTKEEETQDSTKTVETVDTAAVANDTTAAKK